MVGQTVSHYRVVEPLGAGGMGVVYKADDLKLARPVALKFLAPDRTNDRTMVERFMREARTASALNHPNICTIYEVDEHEGLQFIAMELLEGEPLDRRIGGRPLGISAVVDYGMQIADALDIAHGQGILHRDIKPANIFITTRGQAKVVDFGLAKLMEPRRDARESSEGLTRAATDLLTTKQGTALGTIAYMSPEQARGEELDARTDLFSFGLVLYEMATGQRTFEGTTTAVVFDAILNREPRAPIEINANVPLSLERIIGKCLQKERSLRYGAASEIRQELEQVRRERESGMTGSRQLVMTPAGAPTGTTWPSGSTAVAVAPVPARPGRFGRMGLIAAAIVGIAALGGGAGLLQRERQSPPVASSVAAPSAGPVGTSGAPPAPGVAKTTSASTAEAAPPAAPAAAAATPAVAKGATPSASVAPAAGSTGVSPSGNAAAVVAPAATKTAADPGAEPLRVAQAKYDVQLYDQALSDLQSLVTRYASSASAPQAFLLIGSIHTRQNRLDDAMAAYVELRSKYPSSTAVAEATFLNAELILRSRRDDRDKTALDLYSSIVARYPASPVAPRALAKQAVLEQRLRLKVTDEQIGKQVPAELVTYRTLVSRYPSAPDAEAAFQSLAKLYEDQRRYDLAAAVLFDLAKRFPANRIDAAWRAGEMYEERVKDRDRAKNSYALVPPQSSRYRDAQRKLQSGS